MTSSALMYPAQVNEIPVQKRSNGCALKVARPYLYARWLSSKSPELVLNPGPLSHASSFLSSIATAQLS